MTHARKQIRDYVAVTKLGTLSGSATIYKTRQFPKSKYPFIAVYTLRERMVVENPGYTNSNKRYRRQLQVAIDVGVETGDDALDALCLSVEELMAADETMGGGVVATDLTSVDILPVPDAEKSVQQARLTYEVIYRTEASDPETLLS